MSDDALAAWLPAGLEPVALRLARADEAAYKVGRLALAWSREAFEMSEIERRAGWLDLVVTGIRPIPPLLVMLFSEAIHHLRAAIENTLFHLAEVERGQPLPAKHAKHVKIPVLETRTAFDSWQRRVVDDGVIEFDPQAKLGRRIEALQPFADTTASVPTMPAQLAALMGAPVSAVHPMVLLQKYSNIDKHRSIRMAAARTTVIREDESFADADRSMRPVSVGDVLATIRRGSGGAIVELHPAVHVERPQTGVWVSPGTELSRLWLHVSQVVVPTLVTGFALPRGLPPQIDLGDTGTAWAERIAQGGWSTAKERMDAVSLAALDEANAAPVRHPRTGVPSADS
ncbi:hypothetical protein CH253_17980 [Rhodococcus sp. 06-156-3C]|uniref:hypothetical protein n=1 Tax=Nocardiaceae TaxID=85025 RepID=UPI000B1D7724|nr:MULTISPECIES: hypothetical protein [Rhodococcus]OZD18346.1 hypothetical protein CH280_07305 [Rhodococcus sp. 06-156-4C]OZD18944.1 hypothetical protein CH253_17980 [Rhodococcus sp. 06-156-3C]OZD22454.1 hypothetical protein CH248_09565 [Rhodococcus sp. 06-156-4a]OZD34038.1 hypothetical protein CH247_08095 [Rhodococcus sp. 06-156-3b]OZD38775.1 hypothetical protein CH284_06515 [Rhodococcus sp. 06-156-3]